VIERILTEIKMPGNLYVEVPKVNPEIFAKAIYAKKMADVSTQSLLQRQSEVAAILATVVDDIFDERSKMDVNEKKQERDSLKRKAQKLCDALSLLGDSAQNATKKRRDNLQYAIPDINLRKRLMKVPTHKDGVPNTYLFGDDLGDQIKSSLENKRIMDQMKPRYSDRKDHKNSQQPKNSERPSKRAGGKYQGNYVKDSYKTKYNNKPDNQDYKSPLQPLYQSKNNKSYDDKPRRK
jgi:hypothetical protein